ncbi:Helix-turn-helix domain-containing protein [Paenibacillus sp. UNCCL117]|uniref:helix-turn-helix domain-containing protein n=1 Tax=unclassified Paenibacillus TaxID=185978 RepID=UPI0008925A9B|nr:MULTISPECIES: helix-turn-helix domain-containing protein [unclassified Paenibacillus]SDE40967.1 Helix-turn-helix domain-containing protein [Paenibacillus sp. cl123]SFW65417.1 Helix-turn-helix domain-containing protein [Paenibacillus sp. UNCCL117]
MRLRFRFRFLWQKRKSIIFTWLISYSAVLVIPMMMSMIIYSQSSEALKSEIQRANDSLLKQVRYSIDTQIDLMKRLNMEISWNAKLQSLMYSTKPESEAQFLAYQLAKELRMYQTSYATIDEFYVTWDQQSAVLRPGNIRDRETAFDTIHHTGAMRYEQWLETIDHAPGNAFLLLPRVDSSSPQTSIAYVTHLPRDLNGKQTGTVVVMADLERFQKAMESISWFNGGQLLILNPDNQVLMSNLPVTGHESLIREQLPDGEHVMHMPSGNGDTELFYIQSAVSDLKYVLVIPSNMYWQKAEYVRKFTYISILISLMGAGVLTWFFLRRNYSPIRQLVQSLSDKSSPEERTDWNELNFIRKAITNTRSEKEKIALQLQSHHHVLRSNMLNRLLKGKLDTLIPYEEAFKSFHIELSSNRFGVILFAVENHESVDTTLPGTDRNDRRRLIQFIITNVVEELVGQRHHAGYVTELDDMMACLVNFSERADVNPKEDLNWIAAEAQRFLLRFRMDLTVSIGGVHASLAGVSEAYQEAMDAMEYKMVVGKREIIQYDDIRPDPADKLQLGYYYPLQVEQQLINLIKAGDYEQAAGFMHDITERNFDKPFVSLTLAKCLMFNLVGTMVKAMTELGDGDSRILGDNPLWMDKIIACDTLLEMQQELQALLKEVCAFAAAKVESNLSRERAETLRDLISRVMKHIEDHYHDANLNVNTIGERFGLKGSYVSKLFKEQTGEGLLDYITKFRIKQAKLMMGNKQDSISDIAKVVGYNEVATFIRVFKKYEGITPGKFKELS